MRQNKSTITQDTKSQLLFDIARAEESISLGVPICLKAEVKSAEYAIISCALGRADGRISGAARLIGMKRTALHEKAKRMGII